MKNITKDQHFVPRFYLKRFAREGQIQVFDLQAKRIGKPRPYASVCYEKFFYAAETGVQDEISQTFEDALAEIENAIATALPGIIDRAGACQLANDDMDVLACFMSVQWLRTRYFRERLHKMESDARKQVFKIIASFPDFQDYVRSTAMGSKLSDEQIEDVKRFFQSGEYDIRHTSNVSHLQFISTEKIRGFHNLLLVKKWRIVHSKEPHHFITSDNPVAELMPPRTGIFGATFTDRVHILALTPRILMETVPRNGMNAGQPPVERLSYCTVDGKGVLMFNEVLANHGHRFAYSFKTDEFEQLLETS